MVAVLVCFWLVVDAPAGEFGEGLVDGCAEVLVDLVDDLFGYPVGVVHSDVSCVPEVFGDDFLAGVDVVVGAVCEVAGGFGLEEVVVGAGEVWALVVVEV